MKRLQFFAAFAAVALAGAVMSSCGNKQSEASADSQANQAADTAGVEVAEVAETVAEFTPDSSFFAINGQPVSDQGYTTTASGLKYKVIKEGTGQQPTADDAVTVHYTGTLLDGTKFDSSVDRGEVITFPLKGVIPGWTEGLQLMKEGAVYEFIIPADLAYGSRAVGDVIKPNSTLYFQVQLYQVNKQ